MARINLCFLWHMHQPFYRDLVSGEYRLPWTRLHALKDYYGMVKILDEFPNIKQTFNLVPSLLLQIEEYASGQAKDRFLALALKDADALTPAEKELLLTFSFRANEQRIIQRHARYAELWEQARRNAQIPGRAVNAFTTAMLRDLQVLSQLAWFDEEYLTNDNEIRALKEKGRDFTLNDQQTIGRKQRELLGKVVAAYREAARRGQVEISTSPFYHPILPLICDTNIADVSHPYAALPEQFSYPNDASFQITAAKKYIEEALGCRVHGLWPPEGAVCDEVLTRAASAEFQWTASDDSVLQRTLGHDVSAEEKYRPYLWRRGEHTINVLFRDHRLCELIGVVYARMDADQAAKHFVDQLHKECDGVLQLGRDATVTIVLDGENAWEHYQENGRPFLRALYRRICEDPQIAARTVSEALTNSAPAQIEQVFPGSWIDANFDVWIGAEEDNDAWEMLLDARRRFDQAAAQATPENRSLAWEELMIAEGSDWCWWYGPEHSAEGRGEFDNLFRGHLANVYRLLGEAVPADLSRTLLRAQQPQHRGPAGTIQPVIDGKLTSHSEWANAGRYRALHTSGPMHSQKPPVREVLYGSDGQNLYLWLAPGDTKEKFAGLELRIQIRNSMAEQFGIALRNSNKAVDVVTELARGTLQAAFQDAYEVRVSLPALHAKAGSPLFVRIEVWRENLPIACLPSYGELELRQTAMAAYTF